MDWKPDFPRWKQVYEVIEQRIADGEYPASSRFRASSASRS
ncbi:hypothetical protein [Streptomyces sp. WG5]